MRSFLLIVLLFVCGCSADRDAKQSGWLEGDRERKRRESVDAEKTGKKVGSDIAGFGKGAIEGAKERLSEK